MLFFSGQQIPLLFIPYGKLCKEGNALLLYIYNETKFLRNRIWICILLRFHEKYSLILCWCRYAKLKFMSGSFHLDRASNDECSVECLFWFFQPTRKSDLKVVQITKNDIFWVDAPWPWIIECAPNCKTWPKLEKIICNSKYLIFKTNFDNRCSVQITWTLNEKSY